MRGGRRCARQNAPEAFIWSFLGMCNVGPECEPKSLSGGSGTSAIETDLSHDPKQGARLVRAFLGISDPRIRLAIVQMVERLGSSAQGLGERAT